jgi:hypothetical protein
VTPARCLEDLARLDRNALRLRLAAESSWTRLDPPDKDEAELLCDLGQARRRAVHDPETHRVRAVEYRLTAAGLAAAKETP